MNRILIKDKQGNICFDSTDLATISTVDWDFLLLEAARGNLEFTRTICNGAIPWYSTTEDLIGYLIDHRADVNVVGINGNTPLIEALTGGHLSTARLLMAGGADINIVAADGTSPLMLAALLNHEDIARELVTRGATVDLHHPQNGMNALIATATRASWCITDLLHQAGVDFDALDHAGLAARTRATALTREYFPSIMRGDGMNELTKAINNDRWSHVAVILEISATAHARADVDVNYNRIDWVELLEIALENAPLYVARDILAFNARSDAPAIDLNALLSAELSVPAATLDWKIVKLLLEVGADIYAPVGDTNTRSLDILIDVVLNQIMSNTVQESLRTLPQDLLQETFEAIAVQLNQFLNERFDIAHEDGHTLTEVVRQFLFRHGEITVVADRGSNAIEQVDGEIVPIALIEGAQDAADGMAELMKGIEMGSRSRVATLLEINATAPARAGDNVENNRIDWVALFKLALRGEHLLIARDILAFNARSDAPAIDLNALLSAELSVPADAMDWRVIRSLRDIGADILAPVGDSQTRSVDIFVETISSQIMSQMTENVEMQAALRLMPQEEFQALVQTMTVRFNQELEDRLTRTPEHRAALTETFNQLYSRFTEFLVASRGSNAIDEVNNEIVPVALIEEAQDAADDMAKLMEGIEMGSRSRVATLLEISATAPARTGDNVDNNRIDWVELFKVALRGEHLLIARDILAFNAISDAPAIDLNALLRTELRMPAGAVDYTMVNLLLEFSEDISASMGNAGTTSLEILINAPSNQGMSPVATNVVLQEAQRVIPPADIQAAHALVNSPELLNSMLAMGNSEENLVSLEVVAPVNEGGNDDQLVTPSDNEINYNLLESPLNDNSNTAVQNSLNFASGERVAENFCHIMPILIVGGIGLGLGLGAYLPQFQNSLDCNLSYWKEFSVFGG